VDNITHGLAGALLAQAGFRQRYGPVATVALVVGAELPDSDFLFELGGAVTSFVHHRGITHSFIGGVGLALLGAAGLYGLLRARQRMQPFPSYWGLMGLIYLGVLLHIWMDYLTSYGTQVFLPFDTGRYTADAVFIIDYLYTSIIVIALFLVRMVRHQRQQRYSRLSLLWLLLGAGLWWSADRLVQQPLALLAVRGLGEHVVLCAVVVALAAWVGEAWRADRAVALGRFGVVALAAYMALCIAGHTIARQQMARSLGPQMATVHTLAALPLPGRVLWWRGIAETADAYLVSRVTLFPPAVTPPEVIRKQPENGLVQTTSTYHLVRIFRNFARFPVIDYYERDTEKIVRYFDLRYSGYGRKKSGFDLMVYYDLMGQVQRIEFLNQIFLPGHKGF
jgi:inner membrane protein